ncbi:MAG: hypothetical protein U9R19_02840 [Bacteroidota bacterium]|nr:hypothetical protein [Bacteroidota bacterium]
MKTLLTILSLFLTMGLLAQNKIDKSQLFSDNPHYMVVDSTMCEIFAIKQESMQKENIRFAIEKYSYGETVGDIWSSNLNIPIITIESPDLDGFTAILYFSDDDRIWKESPYFSRKSKRVNIFFQLNRLAHILYLLETYENVYCQFRSVYEGRSFATLEVEAVNTGSK